MPLIDFTEIPPGNRIEGQDRFELFARDFLETLGYSISEVPSRGPDQGVDLILTETRTGISGQTELRWLVSCKHFAKSNRAVGLDDEINILDRLGEHNCQGFLGFYSTIASAALTERLRHLAAQQQWLEIQTFDHEAIEKELLIPGPRMRLVERYFPKSFSCLRNENPVRPDLFALSAKGLKCDVCGRALLGRSIRDASGLVTRWYQYDKETGSTQVEFVRLSCEGICSQQISLEMAADDPDWNEMWEGVLCLCNPSIHASTIFGFIDDLATSEIFYSEVAARRYSEVLLETYWFVCRDLTQQEKDEDFLFQRFPRWLPNHP